MTAQIQERLILNGEEMGMAFCPTVPLHHPRIHEVTDLQQSDRIFRSTGCWRQYQGTWEIRDDCLYLVRLRGRLRVEGESIFADWFTGILRVPRGKMMHYIHMGFASIYEQELHIKVEKGAVIGTRTLENVLDQTIWERGWQNLPGNENRFPGDHEM